MWYTGMNLALSYYTARWFWVLLARDEALNRADDDEIYITDSGQRRIVNARCFVKR